MNASYMTRISLAAMCLATLTGCSMAKERPQLPAGSALALPQVSGVVPVYVYIKANQQFSAQGSAVTGIAADGQQYSPLSLEDAESRAGGAEALLSRVSDEGDVAHVAKASGQTLAVLTALGLKAGCEVSAGCLCAAGGAVGLAAGVVGAIGVGAYQGVNSSARKTSMLEEVSLQNYRAFVFKGYVFMPAAQYETLRVPVLVQADVGIQDAIIPVAGGIPDEPAVKPKLNTVVSN